MPKEQKVTLQSPLSELAKPGVLGQNPLLPQAVSHDTSRFSVARIAFTLRRGKEAIKAVLTRDRSRGHVLKTEHKKQRDDGREEVVSASSLTWLEGENKKVVASAELPGEVKMTTEGQSVIFTSETGAIIKYHSSGAFLFSPASLRREQKVMEEGTLPWYNRSHEAVGKEGIRIENILVKLIDEPTRTDTANGTPVVRFTVSISEAPEVQLPVDVYDDKKGPQANRRRISQVLNKKLKPGDEVFLTGHFHADRLSVTKDKAAKEIERRWIRLMSLEPTVQVPSSPRK